MKQHFSSFLNLVEEAKQHVNEMTSESLKTWLDTHYPFYLIDVRDKHELATGHIPTAIHISKGTIERDIEKYIPDLATSIVVYCSGGFRSVLAAENLQRMGYTNVLSLTKGLQGWCELGYTLHPMSGQS